MVGKSWKGKGMICRKREGPSRMAAEENSDSFSRGKRQRAVSGTQLVLTPNVGTKPNKIHECFFREMSAR